jgi:hypothetical protein
LENQKKKKNKTCKTQKYLEKELAHGAYSGHGPKHVSMSAIHMFYIKAVFLI